MPRKKGGRPSSPPSSPPPPLLHKQLAWRRSDVASSSSLPPRTFSSMTEENYRKELLRCVSVVDLFFRAYCNLECGSSGNNVINYKRSAYYVSPLSLANIRKRRFATSLCDTPVSHARKRDISCMTCGSVCVRVCTSTRTCLCLSAEVYPSVQPPTNEVRMCVPRSATVPPSCCLITSRCKIREDLPSRLRLRHPRRRRRHRSSSNDGRSA